VLLDELQIECRLQLPARLRLGLWRENGGCVERAFGHSFGLASQSQQLEELVSSYADVDLAKARHLYQGALHNSLYTRFMSCVMGTNFLDFHAPDFAKLAQGELNPFLSSSPMPEGCFIFEVIRPIMHKLTKTTDPFLYVESRGSRVPADPRRFSRSQETRERSVQIRSSIPIRARALRSRQNHRFHRSRKRSA
jgi:hypothetical protein